MKVENDIYSSELTENLKIIDLPTELLLHIFSFLCSSRTLVALSKTKKKLRAVAFNQSLWQSFQNERFKCPKIINLPLSCYFGTKLLILANDKLAISNNNTKLKIWDLNTNKCSKKLGSRKVAITALARLPDNKLATGDKRGIIRIWDTSTWRCLKVLKTCSNKKIRSVTCLVSSPKGLLFSGHDGGGIKICGYQKQTN